MDQAGLLAQDRLKNGAFEPLSIMPKDGGAAEYEFTPSAQTSYDLSEVLVLELKVGEKWIERETGARHREGNRTDRSEWRSLRLLWSKVI